MDSQRHLTETERDSFYNGLPSRPKLVARSSTIPLRLGLDGWSSERKMNDILGILTRQKVNWQVVNILRIGYADDEMPVILSISALVGHRLNDVHCKIKESRLVNLASVLQQDSHQHPPYFHSYHHFILREDLDTQVFSHVVYTSNYVCLIWLEADSHEGPLSKLSNFVYISPHDLRTLFPCMLKDPKTKLAVRIRGQTLDLKFRLINQVKSITHRLLSNEDTFISIECYIVTERINNVFTERGDSAVSIITSGITRDKMLRGDVDLGLDQAMDVTYTTPMEWLLEDMKACDLSMEILWERQQRLASRGEIR
ncbi:hypothetical protein LX36DRAFT_664318 [Colletotrichum falcatum]|nr:hypothetical protein LX36DRAFT_664318 [Colletotrichum falcatum]